MRRTAPLMGAALSLALAACGGPTPGGDPTDTASTVSPSATSLAPSSSAPTSVAQSHPWGGGHNRADVTFAQMMRVHHQGAVDMSRLAAQRAADPQVKALAAETARTQGTEIRHLEQWLTAWGVKARTPSDDNLADPSMLVQGKTQEEVLDDLRQRSGADFDRAYLDAMVSHHEGGILMSRDLLNTGQNDDAKVLAQQVIDTRTREIQTMQELRRSL